jgi:hypothetical protein
MTLKDQSFVKKVKVSFVCISEDVTFKFWETLKNASEVTLVPKKSFVTILNFVQRFVDCKLSKADGMSAIFSIRCTGHNITIFFFTFFH